MKLQIIVLSVLIAFTMGQNPCDDFTGYEQICNNGPNDFHDLVDDSAVESETACQVLVKTNGGTCQTYCEEQGSTCVAAQDNTGSSCSLDANHERETTEDNGCLQTWHNQICVCDDPAAPTDEGNDEQEQSENSGFSGKFEPNEAESESESGADTPDLTDCSAYTGWDMQCENPPSAFNLFNSDVVGSPTACQYLVTTSGGVCNDYCESQGSICVAGQENLDMDCELWTGQSTPGENNGCDQSWHNQICICDVNAGPCRNFSDYVQKCDNTADDFSDLVNYDVIQSSNACQVLVQTGGDTCSQYCESQGAICVAGQDNTGDSCQLDERHDRQQTEDNGCSQSWNNQVCVCEVRQSNLNIIPQAGPEDPCEEYDEYFSECSNEEGDFSPLVDTSVLSSPTACQVQVYTEGQTCSQYCSSQGAACIAGQDNIGDTCDLDENHDRQTTDGNGCNQSWGNQVCVCDKISNPVKQPCKTEFLRKNSKN